MDVESIRHFLRYPTSIIYVLTVALEKKVARGLPKVLFVLFPCLNNS